MSKKIRYFFNVFFRCGIPFGLIMGVDFFDGFEFSPMMALLNMIMFGGAMGITLTINQVDAVQLLGITDYKYDQLLVHQKLHIKSSQDFNSISNMLKQNFEYKSYKESQKDESIRFKTKLSDISFGEVINVRNVGSSTDQFEYLIESHPAIRLTFMDSAKNLKNVLTIQKLITSVDVNPLQSA